MLLKLNNKTSENFNYKGELETYINILNFNTLRLKGKINDLFKNNKREKRGLINGLGTIIKTISGNLDSNDAEKYDKLFKKIQQNQQTLQNQNLENIRINKKMISDFNKQIENIKHNELILKSRIMQIDTVIKEVMNWENISVLKDIINQLILLSINLIEILNEIETSLTFCNLNKIHSSIISKEELNKIIRQTNENLTFWEISSLITSHCKINKDQIEYLLDIPIYYNDKNNKLLQITPIPNINNNQMFVINEENQLVISNQDKLFGTHDCSKINNNYFCKTNYIETDVCIKNIVVKHNNEECRYHKIEDAFLIMNIENENLAIIASTVNKAIEINCENKVKHQQIKGVYKFKTNKNCKIDNYSLGSKITKAKEIIFEKMNFSIKLNQITDKTLELKQINKEKISVKEIPKIEDYKTKENHHGYINSFVILILIITILLCIFYKNKNNLNCKEKFKLKRKSIESPNIELEERTAF